MTRLGERIGETYEEPLRVAPMFTTTPSVKQPELMPIMLPAEKKEKEAHAAWI